MNRIGRTTIYAIPVIVVLLLTWQFSWIALKAASVTGWSFWSQGSIGLKRMAVFFSL